MAVIAAAHGRLDLALGGSHEVVHELAVHYGPWNRQLLQVASGRAARTRPTLQSTLDYSTYVRTTSSQGDRRVHRGKTTSFVGEELFLLRVSCGHLESNMSTLGKSGHPESNVSTLGMSGHRAKGKEWIHNASSHAHFSDVFCQF